MTIKELFHKYDGLCKIEEIYKNGLDDYVFIQQFNDNWDGGYFSESSAIFINDIK